jgi:thiol-disulfide isomerase/thioredoxin
MRNRISLLVIALTGLACAASPPPPPAPAARGGARDVTTISIAAVDGAAAPLSTALARKPTLVSFWAPWCEPCVRELPALDRLARDAARCGASVLGVAVGERPDAVAAFARARALGYPQYADESFALADALGQRRIPATIVFDAAGKIVYSGDALDARAVQALAAATHAPSCALR